MGTDGSQGKCYGRYIMTESKAAGAETTEFLARREALAGRLAEVVQREGVSVLSFRRAAELLGTSGRMVVYYFRTRDDLIRLVLARVGAEADGVFAGAFRKGMDEAEILRVWVRLAQDERHGGIMRLWTEILSLGARGEAPYDEIAGAIVAKWTAWLSHILDDPDLASGRAEALLAMAEGLSLLDLVRPGLLGRAGEALARRFSQGPGCGRGPES